MSNQNGHLRRCAQRIGQRQRQRHSISSETCVIALGGSGGEAASFISKMGGCPPEQILKIDTDSSMLAETSLEDQYHLSNGGSMEAILRNKDRFPLIRGRAIPETRLCGAWTNREMSIR